MAIKIKRDLAGDIERRVDGKIVLGRDLACPDDCEDCSATGTLTISGLVGDCGEFDCADLNRAYDLVQIGAPDCIWSGFIAPWFTATVQCVDAGGVVAWVVSAGIQANVCAEWTQLMPCVGALTLCPPGAGWGASAGCGAGAVSIAWD